MKKKTQLCIFIIYQLLLLANYTLKPHVSITTVSGITKANEN